MTVLFVDIAGYTRLSERFDLAQVNELVERYFGAFLDEILRHGGDVNETAGDGLMVDLPGTRPARCTRARRCSPPRACCGGRTRSTARSPSLTEPIRLHVGVNSGTAAVGATKIEGTAGTRWTYTASGPVTNLAARLAALGDGDAVVVGSETARRLDGEFPIQDWGERQLRNVEEPVRVFALFVAASTAKRRRLTASTIGRLAPAWRARARAPRRSSAPVAPSVPERFAEHDHAEGGGGERLEERDDAGGGGGDATEAGGEGGIGERGGDHAQVEEQRPGLREGAGTGPTVQERRA